MLCRSPYATSDGKAYGCGQCMPCRSNRRRKWQARIMLEATQHVDKTFVTLTYDDCNIPTSSSGLATLSPADLRGFLDRLRWHFSTVGRRGIRFFAVGEYGDVTERPHYHLALFGVPNCAHGISTYSKMRVRCCGNCELVRNIWGRGNVFLGNLERDSAGYVASYVTKAMTKADDPRLGDRYPEFSRKSLKPGLGAMAMFDVADTLLRYGLDAVFDVPKVLAEGKRSLPLDRYLVRKLRTYVGKAPEAPQEVIDEISAELSAVFERAKAASASAPGTLRDFFRALLLDANDQSYAQWAHRKRLFNKRRNAL